ncbi:hypothetical protein ABZ371_23405, partial [Streptomyces sp. NPDC005899]|uniref:hypothetical protein n=1 Tax=Streptomyces sp. NPDC005899 TaxID=3155716 RepID=UPI0033D9D584
AGDAPCDTSAGLGESPAQRPFGRCGAPSGGRRPGVGTGAVALGDDRGVLALADSDGAVRAAISS